MRNVDDVFNYYSRASKQITRSNPNYKEIKRLLIDQINDELQTIYSSN